MRRFTSFATGFLLALVGGTFVATSYRPNLPSLDEMGYASVFELDPQPSAVNEKLTQVVELFDATKSKLTESVKSWEGIDVSRYLSRSDSRTASFAALLERDQKRIYADISALALAHGNIVSDVAFDERHGWTVLLDGGERVLLGDEEIGKRLHRALSMLESLPSKDDPTTNVVDARYALGIALSTEQPVVALQ